MKPHIDSTKFGSIQIAGKTYDHDVLIGLDGKIRKRKKKLSKKIYGTSHNLSRDEAEYVYEEGAERLIIGTGQYGRVKISDEAREFFQAHDIEVELAPTPEALRRWNDAEGRVIALFHTTC